MEALKVLAPAKVNLFLGIGEAQPDGYHEAYSVLQALTLHDTLSFRTVPEGGFVKGLVREGGGYDLETIEEGGLSIGIETLWREGIEGEEIPLEKNLITRAAFGLARALDFPWKGYLRISVEKHIPSQAGLGGGSSDAAATLVGCAALWGIERDDERLIEVAKSLGVDVPFFLQGGCAAYTDRGDVFERSLEARRGTVLLVLPEGSVATAEAYRRFDLNYQAVPEALLERAQTATSADDVPLYNNLAIASELILPELSLIRAWAEEQPEISEALLCGSGSATFCVCKDQQTGLRLAVRARSEGWSARVTSFTGLRASVLPQSDQTNIGVSRV